MGLVQKRRYAYIVHRNRFFQKQLPIEDKLDSSLKMLVGRVRNSGRHCQALHVACLTFACAVLCKVILLSNTLPRPSLPRRRHTSRVLVFPCVKRLRNAVQTPEPMRQYCTTTKAVGCMRRPLSMTQSMSDRNVARSSAIVIVIIAGVLSSLNPSGLQAYNLSPPRCTVNE
jgi:hypothetical protein